MNQKCHFCGGEVMSSDGRVVHRQDCPTRQLMNEPGRCACGGMNGHHTLDCRVVEMREAAHKHAIDRAMRMERAFREDLKKIIKEALEEHERDKRRDT